MPSDDLEAQHKRRHDAHLRAAENHQGAAVRHDTAAATFEQVGDIARAEQERILAYDQRRKAFVARQRALAEHDSGMDTTAGP